MTGKYMTMEQRLKGVADAHSELVDDARHELRQMTAERDAARSGALADAVDWARSCSGESADVAADYIEEMAAR